jgi:hypothetical protein
MMLKYQSQCQPAIRQVKRRGEHTQQPYPNGRRSSKERRMMVTLVPDLTEY